MKKRIVEVFVCMLLIGTCFVMNLDIVSADQEGDYTYTVSNGEATITGYTGVVGVVTIPSSLGGYPTVVIGKEAFNGKRGITSVIIPNSVTTFEFAAFNACAELTSITIPDSVTTIGGSALSNTGLTSITIPNSVTTIGSAAFQQTPLTSITIPSSVTTIGHQAFMNCYSLSSVTIMNGVTTINHSAFRDCRSLTSIILPNSVTTINNNLFESCTILISVTLGNSVTTIGSGPFWDCGSLTSITFLGLVAPTTIDANWLGHTSAELRGHAYANSNFPVPGNTWNGLMMGEYIGEENEPPVAGFTWTPSSPKTNQTVTFDASASNDPDGSITTYEWDWNNDGTYENSYTTPTTTHSWAQAGSYPVKLQVTDNNDATSTKTLTVAVGGGGGGNGDTDDKGTTGFELVIVIGAIAVSLLLWRKKRNE
jgi:hypothetical protein